MVTNFYNNKDKFNYIRFNSLPAFADYVIDHPKQYYDGWGVQIAHDKPIGIDFDNIKSGDTIFSKFGKSSESAFPAALTKISSISLTITPL